MKIGIGLPSTLLDVPGRLMLDWAGRAEERGFSSLATIDRIAYPNYDSLTALTAAAAVTEEIGLFSNILLAPAYDPVVLAKVTASLDQLSDGRLTLGVGVGGRPDDYAVTGRAFDRRGRLLDTGLELMHRAWSGDPIEPSPFSVAPPTTRGSIPLMIGGEARHAAPRAAEWRAGYTIGGAPAEMARGAIEEFKSAYVEAGGTGEPQVAVLSYYSLGDEHTDESLRNLRSYYGFLGDYVEMIAGGAPRTPEAVAETAAAFEAIGVDELIFDPTVANLDQVDRLADLVLTG